MMSDRRESTRQNLALTALTGRNSHSYTMNNPVAVIEEANKYIESEIE